VAWTGPEAPSVAVAVAASVEAIRYEDRCCRYVGQGQREDGGYAHMDGLIQMVGGRIGQVTFICSRSIRGPRS